MDETGLMATLNKFLKASQRNEQEREQSWPILS